MNGYCNTKYSRQQVNEKQREKRNNVSQDLKDMRNTQRYSRRENENQEVRTHRLEYKRRYDKIKKSQESKDQTEDRVYETRERQKRKVLEQSHDEHEERLSDMRER